MDKRKEMPAAVLLNAWLMEKEMLTAAKTREMDARKRLAEHLTEIVPGEQTEAKVEKFYFSPEYIVGATEVDHSMQLEVKVTLPTEVKCIDDNALVDYLKGEDVTPAELQACTIKVKPTTTRLRLETLEEIDPSATVLEYFFEEAGKTPSISIKAVEK